MNLEICSEPQHHSAMAKVERRLCHNSNTDMAGPLVGGKETHI